MGKNVKITTKAPEVKRENSASQTRKPARSQSRSSPVDRILFLQRTVGNQTVQRIIQSGALQAKLRIGQPNDKYEQEADRVADQVMRMPELRVQRQVEEEEEEPIQTKGLAAQITPLVQRQVEPEEEEEEGPVQTKLASGQMPHISRDIGAQIHTLRGGGQPLPKSVRNFFEPRFGYDFRQVRIHTDARATDTAQAMNARAFTVGRDVVFGAEQYALGTSAGKRLLAHELTHVMQQTRSLYNRNLQVRRKPQRSGRVPTWPRRCDRTHIKAIGRALDQAEGWRHKVLRWFSRPLERLKVRARSVTRPRRVGDYMFGVLKKLDRDFGIQAEVRRQGGRFPGNADSLLDGKDFLKLVQVFNQIHNRFSNVKLRGLKYKCDGRDSCLEYKKDCRLGDAVPGSGEFTIFIIFFDMSTDIGKISSVMHEGFHASFSKFNRDSYFGKAGYPGPLPLTNADSYTTFTRTIARGEKARGGFRFPNVKRSLRSVIEHVK